MHLWLSLPASYENGAVRILQQDKEIILTDGGYEVRNSRWSAPLRSWQIAFNNAAIDSATHAAVEQMWRDTNGGSDTFNFADEREGDTARVRFDAELQFTNTVGPYHHLDTFTIREVRDISPNVTAAPTISGTATVGGVLTAHDATFDTSATVTRQWTSNGADIATATGSTYTLVSGDSGKQVNFYDLAVDAYGGQTKVWATAVLVA